MKIIDITFDLETTSLSADAAILQIGAVAWDGFAKGNNPFFDFGDTEKKESASVRNDKCMYLRNFPLTEQFLAGCDIDKDTQNWWLQQDRCVKHSLTDNFRGDVAECLNDFFNFTRDVCKRTSADAFNLWCQGPDTDIAILKLAVKRYMNISPHNFPVKHTNFRDCRTLILEGGLDYMMQYAKELKNLDADALNAKRDELFDEYIKDPNIVYKYLPSLPVTVAHTLGACGVASAHNALYDAVVSSWNTWCVIRDYDAPEK